MAKFDSKTFNPVALVNTYESDRKSKVKQTETVKSGRKETAD